VLPLAAALLLAALPRLSAAPKETEVTKLDRWTYKALHHGVQVLVSVRLLSVKHREYKYLPLQFSVTNYSKHTVKVDLANIQLTDEAGNVYPVAPPAEVRAEHDLQRYDRERARAFRFEELDPTPARQIESRFYPVEGEVVDPNIEILEGERIVDFLYFKDELKRAPRSFTPKIEGLVDAPALVIPMELPD